MRLARLRARVPEFLLRGTFLRPPDLVVDTVDVPLSRVSIYAARGGGPTVSDGRYPAAIAGAWRADDGRVAVAVASIIDQPVSVALELDPRAWGMQGTGAIERLDAEGDQPLGRWSDAKVPISLELPAGGASVIVLRPDVRP